MSDDELVVNLTRADVDAAMEHLGIHNPKPDIPIETTVSGHEIFAVSRRIRALEEQIERLQGLMGVVD